MKKFTDTQQNYVNKIKNQKLKNLVENSYTIFSLPEDEKTDFVIWMSVIHEDPNAEQELIESLTNENLLIEKEISKNQKPLTDEEIKTKEFEIKSQEYKELKRNLEELKKVTRTEKENETKEKEESKITNLLNQLNKI